MLRKRIVLCTACFAVAGFVLWAKSEAISLERVAAAPAKMPSMEELTATVDWKNFPDEIQHAAF